MSEIKETIQNVLTAEKQADAIIEEATSKSKEILLAASQEASSIVVKSEAAIKASVKDILEGAEKQAKAEYDEIVARGVKEAEELKLAARGKEEKVSDYIANKFKNSVKVNYGDN
ncbi:MAG: hypothetical protein IJS93_03115 [Clostridia bacterium]|nr:hypothetical protein [Clostridia bacterium]